MARPRRPSRHARPARPARPMLASLVAIVLVLACRSAAADDLPPDPQGTTSLLVGAGIATLSFGTGMTLTGTSGDGAVQNTGIVVAQSGLVIAPLAAHGVAGEWRRGLLFALPPLATEIAMLVLIDQWGEKLVTEAPLGTQYLYSSLFTGSVLFSAIGIVDSAGARDRAAAAAPGRHAWVAPMWSRFGGGVQVGGLL